jgi:multidrug efflux system membrane fusion protein
VTDGDRVSVQGELQPGDQVVTDGIDRLREGAPVTVIAAGKVQQVDQAVQDAASQPRSMRNLTPAQREQVAKMSPEERKAFFQKLRAEQGNSANGGGGAPAPAPAAPGLAPAGQPGATAPAGASAAGTGNAAAGAGGGR